MDVSHRVRHMRVMGLSSWVPGGCQALAGRMAWVITAPSRLPGGGVAGVKQRHAPNQRPWPTSRRDCRHRNNAQQCHNTGDGHARGMLTTATGDKCPGIPLTHEYWLRVEQGCRYGVRCGCHQAGAASRGRASVAGRAASAGGSGGVSRPAEQPEQG